jgi:hypothetical protein
MDPMSSKPDAWPWPDTLDAVVAAPGSHRVVYENEHTRVLEVTIATGSREPTHTHRWPSVMLVDRPARIRYYSGDTLTYTSPEKLPPATEPDPRVSWLDPEGPHSVENIDEHRYGAFRIEFKQI